MKRTVTILCVLALALGRAHPTAESDPITDFYSAIRADDLVRLGALASAKDAVNVADAQGMSPLMNAAVIGSIDAIKLLLASGADVNHQSESGATALMLAATDLVKTRTLLESGADPNRATKNGKTALLLAAMSSPSIDIVRLLIAKGASVKAVDRGKMTALMAAVVGNDTGTIRLMIDAGVDVNAANAAGLTPLMMAAGGYGNARASAALLAKGAKVNAVSAPSLDPNASKAGPVQLGLLTPLLMTVPFGPPALVRTLIEAGADVNAKDVRGMTPLMLAVATDRQDPAVVRLLLEHGADAAAKSAVGETAADWARKIGRRPALEILHVRTDPAPTAAPVADAVSAAESVGRSLALMEKASPTFYEGGGCVSCHHQAMSDLVAGEARLHGLQLDEAAGRARAKMAQAYYVPAALYERDDPPGAPEQTAYSLIGLSSMGYPADRMTDAMVANIAAGQGADGGWHGNVVARPPGEEGDIFRTALSLRAMKLYGPPGRRAELQQRVDWARRWIAAAKPVSVEDRNMQLMGLAWAGDGRARLNRLARAIVSAQQEDGGWRPSETLSSDAYATGESLYTLVTSGLDTSDPAFQRGLAFLLRTQAPDGSWRVASRSPKLQVYFNGGFPYAGNQWISAWGTGWAALAVAQAIPIPSARAR